MIGLAVTLLILSTIVSVMYDLELFQKFWKWMKI